MKKLYINDPIKMGVYTGETVKSCISKYGRKSILKILQYYDLDDEIMKKYHYHKTTPEESLIWESKIMNKEQEDIIKEVCSKESESVEDISHILENEDYYDSTLCENDVQESYGQYPLEWEENLTWEDILNKSYKFWIYGE